MRSIEVEVRSESGLHARPAAAFARAAAGFSSTVRLENVTTARPAADAKSIVGVLSAGVERGHVVRIVADGADEDRAVDTLRELLAGLGERAGEGAGERPGEGAGEGAGERAGKGAGK